MHTRLITKFEFLRGVPPRLASSNGSF